MVHDGCLDGYVVATIGGKGSVGASQPSRYLIEVTFEGELTTAICFNIPTCVLQLNKHAKLLRASDIRELSLPSSEPPDAHAETVVHPFHFRIPVDREADYGRPMDEEQQLPPSLTVKSLSVYELGDVTLQARCRIQYRIRARILADESTCIAEDEVPVTFAPAYECPPPVCIGDFPQEYVLQASRRVRQLFPSRGHYDLAIHTEEPPPLYLDSSSTAFTTVSLRLRYSNQALSRGQTPPELSAVSQLSLLSTTFLSVVPQKRVPNKADAHNSKNYRLVAKTAPVGLTQMWKLRISDWKARTDQHTDRPEWESTTRLVFPWDLHEYLAPTFTCPFASKRYSLRVLVHIDGPRDTGFRLQVPLHVSYAKKERETPSADQLACTLPHVSPGLGGDVERCLLPVYTE
ncbi:hypothetical protein BO71DRAFT_383909 [Aspergillus ellipticus CBS 707.79]|uniref:Arrestin-like N-terminal domain-containing protein n=1 Tax=Aspergillus ellipticus CBS 707.79 TaxID=1448320 RepID=A0A319D545_9EURO|nr:hypothetical protein BO71DRAFT_383909 [Aspergillus ellipticus CBS 707.79]